MCARGHNVRCGRRRVRNDCRAGCSRHRYGAHRPQCERRPPCRFNCVWSVEFPAWGLFTLPQRLGDEREAQVGHEHDGELVEVAEESAGAFEPAEQPLEFVAAAIAGFREGPASAQPARGLHRVGDTLNATTSPARCRAFCCCVSIHPPRLRVGTGGRHGSRPTSSQSRQAATSAADKPSWNSELARRRRTVTRAGSAPLAACSSAGQGGT